MLRDLTVQNYRCFENFQIDGLEQVNLFVGKNNSGKTSLLEAIFLLADHDKIDILIAVMLSRGEGKFIPESTNRRANFISLESIENLFHSYEIVDNQSIFLKSVIQDNNNKYQKHLEISYEKEPTDNSWIKFIEKDNNEIILNESIETDENNMVIFSSGKYTQKFSHSKMNHIFISNPKKRIRTLQYHWDNIYLTEKEDKVIKAIQLLNPTIMRVGFYSNENRSTIRFKVKDHKRPIPLSSMGEGMYRFLMLSIALVSAEDGVLLVDEIETGLHYEAQTDMWRLILETAKELNVQVFATTHSWDCIAAFQEALEKVEDQSIGKLFRLDSKYGKLRAVSYDAEDLEVVTRESIEVR